MHLMPENLVEIFRLRNVIFRSKIKTPSITFQWERQTITKTMNFKTEIRFKRYYCQSMP